MSDLDLALIPAILFEDAVILGAETDTILYSATGMSSSLIPFSTLERTVKEPIY